MSPLFRRVKIHSALSSRVVSNVIANTWIGCRLHWRCLIPSSLLAKGGISLLWREVLGSNRSDFFPASSFEVYMSTAISLEIAGGHLLSLRRGHFMPPVVTHF